MIRWPFSMVSGLHRGFLNRHWLRENKLGSLAVFEAYARKFSLPLFSQLDPLEMWLLRYYQKEAPRIFVRAGVKPAIAQMKSVFRLNLGKLRCLNPSLNCLPEILLYLKAEHFVGANIGKIHRPDR